MAASSNGYSLGTTTASVRTNNSAGTSNASHEENENSESMLLGTTEPAFQPLHLYCISLLNCALLIGFGVFIWIFPGWPSPTTWIDEQLCVFLIVSINGSVWLFLTISDRVLSNRHHIVRRHGYLDFYRRLEFLRRLPFYTISATSVSLAVLLANCIYWIPDTAAGEPSRLLIIQGFLSVEILLVLPLYFVYTVVIIKFNQAAPLADVDRAPFSGSNAQQRGASSAANSVSQRTRNGTADTLTRSSSLLLMSSEVGVHDEPQLEQLLDRQADLITYYRQRNKHLLRQLARLSAIADERNAVSTGANGNTRTNTNTSMVNT